MSDRLPRLADWLIALAFFLILPALVTLESDRHRVPGSSAAVDIFHDAPSPPPKVVPLIVRKLSTEDARAINAATPFSSAPNPAARPFLFHGSEEDKERAVICLASAQYYEAGDDPVGQKAVAQVVLNRVRHPAFAATVCGVVFQGSERVTGCQFTFTCDGAIARKPAAAAWGRARALATQMLAGMVDRTVGYATHYHTDWVVPYWNTSLDKITEVHTHLFYRWKGWWGTPPAFRRPVDPAEPRIAKLANLSPAHAGGTGPTDSSSDPALLSSDAAEMARAPLAYTGGAAPASLVKGLRIIATSPENDAFLLELPVEMGAADYPATARAFCSGRPACKIMAWRAGSNMPRGLPVDPVRLDSMIFSYIHDADGGLQRILWNCFVVPQPDKRNCMRARDPAATAQPDLPDPSLPTPRQTGVSGNTTHALPPASSVSARQTSPAKAP